MRIYLRVPMQDVVDKGTVRWLLWLERQPETSAWDINLHDACGWGVANARNDIIRAFLQTDCTHLWMVDADVAPPFSLKFLEGADAYPVLAGAYLGVTARGLRWHVYHDDGEQGWAAMRPQYVPQTRYFHADAAGAGCLLLQRQVLEQVGPDPFEFRRNEAGIWMGEDMLFGRRIKGVMVDTEYVCEHNRRSCLTHILQTSIKDLGPCNPG